MKKLLAGMAGALAWIGPALAQDDVVIIDDSLTASPTVEVVEKPVEYQTPRFRINALAGGAHYATSNNSKETMTLNGVDPGPAYGVLLGFQPSRWIGIEGQYEGASNEIDRSEVITGFDRITANGVTGHVRVQAPFRVMEPFLFGGVGFMRLDENGAGVIADRHDNLLTVPVGGGIDGHLPGGLNLGARFTYNILEDTALPEIGNSDLWMATLNLGAAL